MKQLISDINYKRILLYVCILVIGVIAMNIIWGNIIQYHTQVIEPDTTVAADYVKLEEDTIVRQEFQTNIEQKVCLKSLSSVFVNLPEGEKAGELIITICGNKGNILGKSQYKISDIAVGDYQEFLFDRTVILEPNNVYTIEFQAIEVDAVPYLLLQTEENQNRYNHTLYVNDEYTEGGLLLKYQHRQVLPNEIKIMLSVIVVFCLCSLFGCLGKENNIVQKYAEYIVLSICILSFLSLFILGKYDRPSADDFTYGIKTHAVVESGNYNLFDVLVAAAETDIEFYNSWQGLYSSAFILSLHPGIFGEKYYILTPIIIISFIAVVLYYVMSVIRKRFCGTKKHTIYWTILFTTVLIQGLPSGREGIYWFNGAMNYMPFVFLTMLNMALVIEYFYSEDKKAIVYIIISTILSFVISGGNHVTAFLNILLLLILSYIAVSKRRYAVIISLIVAVVGFLIVYFAPGTAIRQNLLLKQSVVDTIIASGIEVFRKVGEWINLQWICFILLQTPFTLEIIRQKKVKRLKYHPLIILSVSFVVFAGILCVPYYAMGGFGEGRLTNVVWITFIMLSVINYTYLLVYINTKIHFVEKIKVGRWKCLSIVFVLGICLLGNYGKYKVSNSVEAINELYYTKEAEKCAAELDARFFQIKNSDEEIVYLPAIQNRAPLIYGGYDITLNWSEWPNNSFNGYYGVRVALKQ